MINFNFEPEPGERNEADEIYNEQKSAMIDDGKLRGAKYLLIVEDRTKMPYEIYPVFVEEGDNLGKIKEQYNSHGGQVLKENEIDLAHVF